MANQCTTDQYAIEVDPSAFCSKNQCRTARNSVAPEDIFDIQGALDEIVEDRDLDEAEKTVVEEFLETKQKTKYLFDGLNLIKLKASKSATLRAIKGKVLWLRKKIKDRINNVEKVDILENLGHIEDHIQPPLKIPQLLYHCINEIEARDPVESIYAIDGCPTKVRKIMKQFARGKIPNVSGEKIGFHLLC